MERGEEGEKGKSEGKEIRQAAAATKEVHASVNSCIVQ